MAVADHIYIKSLASKPHNAAAIKAAQRFQKQRGLTTTGEAAVRMILQAAACENDRKRKEAPK